VITGHIRVSGPGDGSDGCTGYKQHDLMFDGMFTQIHSPAESSFAVLRAGKGSTFHEFTVEIYPPQITIVEHAHKKGLPDHMPGDYFFSDVIPGINHNITFCIHQQMDRPDPLIVEYLKNTRAATRFDDGVLTGPLVPDSGPPWSFIISFDPRRQRPFVAHVGITLEKPKYLDVAILLIPA
jgi:hypothetical protein